MFKELGQLASLAKHAHRLRGEFEGIQESLKRLRVEGASGGGLVRVVMNGHQELMECTLDPALVASGDREMLEDLIAGAVNQAVQKSRESAAEHLARVTSQFDFPGIQELLGKLGAAGGG